MTGESIFDGNMAGGAIRIGDTPLSISVYSVEKAPTRIHDKGMLEIIFCLKGSVRFSYAYEEFTLHAGEYISVDKDAYYLYDGRDNLCVSFYFDLTRYTDKYPFICNNLFVCEGLAETTMRYPTSEHRRLKGMMIALLKYIRSQAGEKSSSSLTVGGACADSTSAKDISADSLYGGVLSAVAFPADVAKTVSKAAEEIVDLFVEYFDVFFFHAGDGAGRNTENLRKLHKVNDYMHSHMKEKVTVGDLARELNFTEGYMSEYLRKVSVGFSGMLNYIRANASEHLLLKTNKKILEIAEDCGFSDVKYYYSAFRRWYKCTPRQFRERYGRAQEERITYLDMATVDGVLDGLLVEHYMDIFLPRTEKRIIQDKVW